MAVRKKESVEGISSSSLYSSALSKPPMLESKSSHKSGATRDMNHINTGIPVSVNFRYNMGELIYFYCSFLCLLNFLFFILCSNLDKLYFYVLVLRLS